MSSTLACMSARHEPMGRGVPRLQGVNRVHSVTPPPALDSDLRSGLRDPGDRANGFLVTAKEATSGSIADGVSFEVDGPEPMAAQPEPLDEERAAIIEHDGAIPRDWAEGFARLHPDRPPGDVPRRRWQTFIDDCGRFLDTWGAEALALGWGPLELFGCDGEKPFARVDQMGLIWFIKGGHVASMSMSAAVIETAIGVRQTYRRRPVAMGEVALPWELTEEQARLSRNGALPGVDMTI